MVTFFKIQKVQCKNCKFSQLFNYTGTSIWLMMTRHNHRMVKIYASKLHEWFNLMHHVILWHLKLAKLCWIDKISVYFEKSVISNAVLGNKIILNYGYVSTNCSLCDNKWRILYSWWRQISLFFNDRFWSIVFTHINAVFT